MADHDEARHLAALNPGLSVHTARRISWTRRGERFAAGMLVPHGSAPKTGWPLVINVYGGSRISTLVDDYDPDNGILHASLLTSRGWAVMFPDQAAQRP